MSNETTLNDLERLEAEGYFFFDTMARLYGSSARTWFPHLVEAGFKAGPSTSQKPESRLTETLLSLVPEEVPGIILWIGDDLGPSLRYLARVLGQTKIYGVMTNRHVADEARNLLREEDLSLMAPVFCADLTKTDSYRIVGSAPLVMSPLAMRSHPEPKSVLEAFAHRVPRGGKLITGGFFLKDRTKDPSSLPHGDLLADLLWPSGLTCFDDWVQTLSLAGFEPFDTPPLALELREASLGSQLRTLMPTFASQDSPSFLGGKKAREFSKVLHGAWKAGYLEYSVIAAEKKA